MSNIIPVRNTLAINATKTFLTNAEVSGTNVLRWKNPNGFSASCAVQIGETGDEQSEVKLLGTATPSGTAGTLTANTDFEHPADTPLYAIKYNQVVFARSTTGTTGTPTVLTDGTVTYTADGTVTSFDDTSGLSTYAYRVYFQNSVTAGTSDFSDWITPSGFSFYSLAAIRNRSKEKMWDSSFIRNDSTWDNWTNEFKDRVTNKVIQVNEDYALGTVDVGFDGTDGYGTVTTADFSQIRKMDITYNGQDWYRSIHININDFIPDQVFSSTKPHHAWLGDTIFQVHPNESGGTARIVFYRFGTTMVNDTDVLPLPLRSMTDKFVDYNLLQAQYKDGKLSFADKKVSEESLVSDVASILTPRDKSGPQYIDLVEGISGEDGGSI